MPGILGTKQKILLLIAMPLAMQLFFVMTLLSELSEIGKARSDETRTIEVLAALNTVTNDFLSCGCVLMFQPKGAALPLNYERLLDDSDHLKRILLDVKGKESSPNLMAFIKTLNDFTSACSGTEVFSMRQLHSFGLTNAAKDSSWRITQAGELAIDEQSKIRDKQVDECVSREEELKQTTLFASSSTIVMALIAILYMAMDVGRKFRTLMKNTERISSGEPLLPALKGGDELVSLDALLHELSARLQSARERERALIESSVMVICSLDQDLRLIEISKAVERLLGVHASELDGESLFALIHPEEKQEALKSFSNCKDSSGPCTFQLRLLAKKKKTIYTGWTAQWSSEQSAFFCVVEDMSKRHAAETAKAEIYAMVSHDLRSPLSSMLVSLDMMSQPMSGSLRAEGTELLDESRRSIQSLITLINDLVDFERFQSGAYELDLQIARLRNLIEETIERAQKVAANKGVEIALQCEELDIRADTHQLARALAILLRNGIARSPAGSKIKIEAVKRVISGRPHVEFRCQDFGKRLSGAAALDLFSSANQSHEQAEELSRFSLPLLKAIVEAHSGEVGLDSSPHGLTSIWLRIPL